jgi:hypothetical protein
MYYIVPRHKKTVIERASELINIALSAHSVSKFKNYNVVLFRILGAKIGLLYPSSSSSSSSNCCPYIHVCESH